ncbi:MAG TPA: RecQ family ATP-dependent DNA helicase, partial [Saprospiraceae bacterium]|nr:RecQ family ATP-dependent DNA helicase [Saprospiraceae bacterium]
MSPIEISLQSMNSNQLLKQYFGYDSFRPGQEAIIKHILAGKDCLVLMPTGGGKSMCFQIPALAMEGTAIVISPLIALMKDQVDALKINGVAAAFLNSSQTSKEQQEVLSKLESGEIKLLYIAPERLSAQNNSLLQIFKNIKLSLFAIDESHCISHWGHDFRPDYLSLGKLKTLFPAVPVVALTATADKQTRTDILQKLSIEEAEIFISSFNRPNLRYTVESKDNHYGKLLEFLEDRKDESGIIYCLSRQNTEDLA